MSAPWVIKLPLAENAGGAVLVHVTPKDSKPLDLDLLATDGESAFKGKGKRALSCKDMQLTVIVRSRKLDQLRHENYVGSEEEWTAILKHVFISKQGSGVSGTIKKNLDVFCAISGKDPNAALSISLRTRVEDITQRLGSLELAQTEDTDKVDLFGWAGQAIDQRDKLESQIAEGREEANASTSTIASMQAQLKDLVKAKAEHETELLEKLAALLNEKKMRLRELNRHMSTAKVDHRALERLEATLPSGSSTRPRGKKRSARETAQASEFDESDGFEAMDVDKPANEKKAAESDDDRHTTENETETESDDGDNLDMPTTSQTEAGSIGSSKLPPKQQEQSQSLPPPRNLPFTRQTTQAAKETKPPSPPEDEETASEDDEL